MVNPLMNHNKYHPKCHALQEGIAEKGKLGQFEVFGLDVIVDADQRVYLLEPWVVVGSHGKDGGMHF